jgi:hypothetical protein
MKPMRVGEPATFKCHSCRVEFYVVITQMPDVRVPQCPYACPCCKAETLARESECTRMSKVQAAAKIGFDTLQGDVGTSP